MLWPGAHYVCLGEGPGAVSAGGWVLARGGALRPVSAWASWRGRRGPRRPGGSQPFGAPGGLPWTQAKPWSMEYQ